jgi:hypothetical protein
MSLSWGDTAGIVIIAPAASVAEAAAATAAGAQLVDVGSNTGLIGAVRGEVGGVDICADGGDGDVVRDAEIAARTGAGLICADVDAAAAAVRLGVTAGRVAVQTVPAGIEAVRQAGWAVLAELGAWADSPAGAQAAAAVCVWLGASALRTRHVAGVRRSADMTEAIMGRKPPVLAVRGLA